MMDYTSSDWWKFLPCHLCPRWNLKGEMNLDVRKLKQSVDWSLEDDPDFMPIEHLLFRAFLEVPPEGYLMKGRSSPETALKFLKEAEDLVDRIVANDKVARDSYGLVINAFRMWLYNDGNFKESSKVDELNETLTNLHKSVGAIPTPHIDVVLATALRRLGLNRYDEAITLLDKATSTSQYASNKHWLFCKAVLIGRKARSQQKSARGKMSEDERKEMFSVDKSIFQELVDASPDFARARAYLGESLYNLNEKSKGAEELCKAYNQSPNNREVAVKYGKVLRWYEKFEESERILTSVKDWDTSEEVPYQLALIYQKMGKDEDAQRIKREEYNQRALQYVDQAVHFDKNHVPALCTRGQLTVALGDHGKARGMYFDLLRGKDISPEQLYYLRCDLNNKPELIEIFTPIERLLNAYNILLLCTEHFVKASNSALSKKGRKDFQKSYKLGTDEAIDVIESEIHNKTKLKLEAMRFLSDITFRLGDFQRADSILTELQEMEEAPKYRSQILWQRGKSLCALGHDGIAEHVAELLQKTETDDMKCRELFADIHLMRAKSTLGTHRPPLSTDEKKGFVKNLSSAIDYGSLEACYVFLTETRELPQQVCREDNDMAAILANIRRCTEREDSVHHEFDRNGHSGDNTPVATTIGKLLGSILTYPKNINGLPGLLKTRYELLTKIRVNLNDLEYTFRYLCQGEWDHMSQQKAEQILADARNLLDHIIYQRAVLDEKPMKTIFPIHNKDTKKKTVEEKLEGYLNKYFNKAEPPVPDHMKKYLIELQPMLKPDNNWLNALCSFVNNAKHTGSDDGDTIHFEGKLGPPINYKKIDLVRISCCRVERIAVKLLEHLEELHDNKQTKPGFSD